MPAERKIPPLPRGERRLSKNIKVPIPPHQSIFLEKGDGFPVNLARPALFLPRFVSHGKGNSGRLIRLGNFTLRTTVIRFSFFTDYYEQFQSKIYGCLIFYGLFENVGFQILLRISFPALERFLSGNRNIEYFLMRYARCQMSRLIIFCNYSVLRVRYSLQSNVFIRVHCNSSAFWT